MDLQMLVCRFCLHHVSTLVFDFDSTPIANTYLQHQKLQTLKHPLNLYVCNRCYLTQLGNFVNVKQIFSNYAYSTSMSDQAINFAKKFVEQSIKKFNLNSQSMVVEIGSNDGYLLQFYAKKNIPHLGIDPARNLAVQARKKGVHTKVAYFNTTLAKDIAKLAPKLIIANNVLAHNPNIHEFMSALAILINNGSYVSVEIPSLQYMMEDGTYDLIYHEHFYYFSLYTFDKIAKFFKIQIIDCEKISTHGGSYRILLGSQSINQNKRVQFHLNNELKFGINKLNSYSKFANRVKHRITSFKTIIKEYKADGKKIAGYGASAKLNTLLHACKLDDKDIEFIVDKSPYKQNKYLPCKIPIYSPKKLNNTNIDVLIVFAWNLQDEIKEQLETKFELIFPHETMVTA